MTRWYLDSSAALKLIQNEAESAALQQALDTSRPMVVACRLLETEMRRAVQRNPALDQELVTELLERVNLCEVTPSTFREAGLMHGSSLRSLDAVHLAAAVGMAADAVVTYDHRMAGSARALGFKVLAPA